MEYTGVASALWLFTENSDGASKKKTELKTRTETKILVPPCGDYI